MRLPNWTYKHVLPFIAWIAMKMVTSTLRIKRIGEHNVESITKSGKKVIFAIWHGRQFLIIPSLSRWQVSVMVSTSRDGLLIAKVLKKYDYTIIPGSSHRSPLRALRGSIKSIQEGYNYLIAVDGPTGPIHKIKPGVIYLAKKTNAVIIPVTYSARPAKILNSWDRYVLPKPFAKAVLVFGDPFSPSHSVDDDILKKECHLLETSLKKMTQKADEMVSNYSSSIPH